MFWYLLNILILTVVWFFLADTDLFSSVKQDFKKKIICVIGTLNWIILSGFRDLSVGADTLQYLRNFENVKNMTWDRLFSNLADKYIGGADIKDPGYALFEKSFQLFSDNYRVFLVFIAILFFSLLGLMIYKFSSAPYESFVLFSTLFYSFFAITGIRQTVATALVVLIGSFCIKNKKLLPFLVLSAVAMTIHASAMIFVPFYFLSRIKINKITLGCYWAAIALSFIFRYELLAVFQAVGGYEEYQDYEGAGASTFMYMLIAIAVLATLFYKFLLESQSPIITMSLNALFIATFFSSFLLINQSAMRIVQYFSLFLMFLLPEFKMIFKTRRSVMLYRISYVALLIVLFIRTNPTYSFM